MTQAIECVSEKIHISAIQKHIARGKLYLHFHSNFQKNIEITKKNHQHFPNNLDVSGNNEKKQTRNWRQALGAEPGKLTLISTTQSAGNQTQPTHESRHIGRKTAIPSQTTFW